MALANFFDKSALAASQILIGYDRTEFEHQLLDSPIEVAFDQNATERLEGKATLELTIKLLARLYPTLVLSPLDSASIVYSRELESLARRINPKIEFDAKSVVATLIVGSTNIERQSSVFYLGSDNWTVKFSSKHPVGSGVSSNIFAAGASACFGAANIFRYVFRDYLDKGDVDTEFTLSLADFSPNDISGNMIAPDIIGKTSIQIGESILVGLGAIGNGFVWALSNTQGINGTLHNIDPEKIDLSNLQRYVLTEQSDIDKSKTEITHNHLVNTDINVISHNCDWATFLKERADWKLDTVISAVDSGQDRLAIQASLPKYLLNAWTQTADLGISRHLNFLEDACLACLYQPRATVKSESQLIAESFGLPEEEFKIREMLYNNAPIDDDWLAKIAQGKSVPIDLLTPYAGKQVREFYHTVFCGGIIIGKENSRLVETPMAFQSVLAGILLASELVINKAGLRSFSIATTTRINLLKPLGEYLNDPVLKHADGRCICQDADFQSQYKKKYPDEESRIF